MNNLTMSDIQKTKLACHSVSVAVIDSGIDPSHVLIKGIKNSIFLTLNRQRKIKHIQQDGDIIGHGTACAGIIRAYAPEAQLYSIGILDENLSAPEVLMIEALRWCIAHHMDVVNLSMGTTSKEMHEALKAVCQEACAQNVIVVAAEHSCGLESYPATFPTVIGVGAADIKDSSMYFYRPGEQIEFLARGNEQRLAWTNPRYIFKAGTSFAAPHITGRVAQIREQCPGASLEQVMEVLKANASPGSVEPYYPGRVQCTHDREAGECVAIKRQTARNTQVEPPLRDFSWIKRAVVYPYGKEAHSLVRFRDLLPFELVGVVDPVGKGLVGKDAGEVIGCPPANIRITAHLPQALEQADTLILGYTRELRRIGKRDVLCEMLQQCLDLNKHVFAFDRLSRETYRDMLCQAQSKGLHFEWPQVQDEEKNAFLGDDAQSTVPVVGVFGTSSSQGKFTAQLSLRRGLLRAGYRVGQLGTEHHSALFGMDACFPYGYGNNVALPLEHYAAHLRHVMQDIETRVHPQIILVGAQSGTIPFDLSIDSFREMHSLPTLAFLLGTRPDAYILTVNNLDPYEYIQDTIHALKALGKGRTILLTMSDQKRDIQKFYGKPKMVSAPMDRAELKDNLKALEDHFGIPATDVVSPEGEEKLVQTVIAHFSEA